MVGSGRAYFENGNQKSHNKRWAWVTRLDAQSFVKLYQHAQNASSAAWDSLPPAMFMKASNMTPEQIGRAFATARTGNAITFRPTPSAFYPTINATLDQRIQADGLERDGEFLELMAALTPADQWAFFHEWRDERKATPMIAMSKSIAARRVRMAAWQRPLLEGDDEAQRIFRALRFFLTHERGMARQSTKPAPDEKWFGLYMRQFAGTFFSDPCRRRWLQVFEMYGLALETGADVGDDVTPPWEQRR